MSDFVGKHETIDQAIKIEKTKRKLISRVFLMIDILMSVLIVGVRIFMIHYTKVEPIFYS